GSRREPRRDRRQAAGRAGRRADRRFRLSPARHRPGRRGARGDAAPRDGRHRVAHRARPDGAGRRVHPPDEPCGGQLRREGMRRFSLTRWWGIVRKEFLQLRRDRITFGMIVGMPIIQLILFGYAINTDPRHLPTAVVIAEQSEFTRSFLAAMKTSRYFEFVAELTDEEAARAALARGEVQFVGTFPADFTRRLLRGERPALLLEADATDPAAAGAAIASVRELAASVARKDLKGALAPLTGGDAPFEVRVHKLYNPEGLTQHNIVPGLMGVILTMTMVMMTGLAMTRERERGTMENLLATPAQPLEVMTGKIVPYIFIGLIQSTIILLAARYLFDVPFVGSLTVLYVVALLFIAANLTVGITLSSLAQNQLQAMQ